MGGYRLELDPPDQGRPLIRTWQTGGFTLYFVVSPAGNARGGHETPAVCSLFRPSTGSVAINSDQFRALHAAPGDLSYYPPGTVFRLSCQEPHEYAIVGLSPERLASIAADVVEGDPEALAVTVPIRTSGALHLSRLLHDCVTAMEDRGALYRESLLTLVVAEAIRHARRSPASPLRASLAPAVLRRVLTYIEEHLADDIGLETLAAVAGLSPYHFARCFRQDTGKPPYRYVRDRRLESAGSLLSRTTLPIADIAARCGFSSPGHLSTAFRKAFGVTPLQYRTDRS